MKTSVQKNSGYPPMIIQQIRSNGITEPFEPFHHWNLVSENEEIKKATLRNIIDSYQSKHDLFIELLQNAVDPVELRTRQFLRLLSEVEPFYRPQVRIFLNLPENEVSVVDNGWGMSREELMHMLLPNFSTKDKIGIATGSRLRGHKGVGASFLSYGFDYIRVSTKGTDGYLSFQLSGGRSWAMGANGHKEPFAVPAEETIPFFHQLDYGTAVTLRLGANTRPSSLSRLGSSLQKWEMNLRSKTAVGFVDLASKQSWAENVLVRLILIGEDGEQSSKDIDFSYPLPHLAPYFDFLDLKDYYEKNPEQTTIKKRYQNMHAIYRSWSKEDLIHPHSGLLKKVGLPPQLSHVISVYGFFAYRNDLFESISKSLVDDQRVKAVRAGVWLASNNAVIGRQIPLELGYGAGNADRLFMLVEMEDIRPDLGRKGFDPDLEEEIRKLGDKVVSYFVARRKHLKPAGIQSTQANHRKELDLRIREAEDRADKSPLYGHYSLKATPENEPEVIALFLEMLGQGKIIGYDFYGFSYSSIYDGIFSYCLDQERPNAIYHPEDNPLGISIAFYSQQQKIELPVSLMEFKTTLDSLVEECSSKSSPKRFENLSLAVVWTVGSKWEREFDLEDLTDSDLQGRRELFGVTHHLSRKGVEDGHVLPIIELKSIVRILDETDDGGC